MTDTQIFEDVRIRAKWYELNGLMRAWTPKKKREGPQRKRGVKWAASFIASSLIGASVATATLFPISSQAVLVWPANPTAEHTRQMLADSVQKLKAIKGDWTGYSTPAPLEKSLKAAEHILPQLPNVLADAQAGVDGDGHVYFRLRQGDKVAYLTIEPRLMHLFYSEPGKENIYVDDEQFKGKILPARIRNLI